MHKQDKGSVSPFQAVTTALAGTIGTGSIAGVATALVLGGPMYYIKNGLGVKWLAAVFAAFAMIACIGTGNATQSNSISGVLALNFNVAP